MTAGYQYPPGSCLVFNRKVSDERIQILGAATALGLVMSAAAFADSNNAYVDQSGDYNSALITQGGSGNEAGKQGRVVRQTSNEKTGADRINRLTIAQGGDNNKVGLGANGLSLSQGDGVIQLKNYLPDPQNNLGGYNTIDINQATNSNVIGAISQYTATHLGGNSLTVRQEGGDGNQIAKVMQYRTQTTTNEATVTQDGDGNVLQALRQVARNAGNKNTITATFNGDGNGANPMTGAFSVAAGAASSEINQGVDINTSIYNSNVNVLISGDNNAFGVTQVGGLSKLQFVANLSVLGSENQTAIYQGGTHQTASLTVDGSYNDVGIRQLGSTNGGVVTVTGNDNNLGLLQNGSGNLATINLFGDGNNVGALSGAAAIAGLTTGLVSPLGNGNTATLTVGTLAASDGNRFGVLQSGDDNTATATVSGGDGNQFGISQVGSDNVASLTQTGSFNVAGISQ